MAKKRKKCGKMGKSAYASCKYHGPSVTELEEIAMLYAELEWNVQKYGIQKQPEYKDRMLEVGPVGPVDEMIVQAVMQSGKSVRGACQLLREMEIVSDEYDKRVMYAKLMAIGARPRQSYKKYGWTRPHGKQVKRECVKCVSDVKSFEENVLRFVEMIVFNKEHCGTKSQVIRRRMHVNGEILKKRSLDCRVLRARWLMWMERAMKCSSYFDSLSKYSEVVREVGGGRKSVCRMRMSAAAKKREAVRAGRGVEKSPMKEPVTSPKREDLKRYDLSDVDAMRDQMETLEAVEGRTPKIERKLQRLRNSVAFVMRMDEDAKRKAEWDSRHSDREAARLEKRHAEHRVEESERLKERHAEHRVEDNERSKQWQLEHRVEESERSKNWHTTNSDVISARRELRYGKNREETIEKAIANRAANRERDRETARVRRMAQLERIREQERIRAKVYREQQRGLLSLRKEANCVSASRNVLKKAVRISRRKHCVERENVIDELQEQALCELTKALERDGKEKDMQTNAQAVAGVTYFQGALEQVHKSNAWYKLVCGRMLNEAKARLRESRDSGEGTSDRSIMSKIEGCVLILLERKKMAGKAMISAMVPLQSYYMKAQACLARVRDEFDFDEMNVLEKEYGGERFHVRGQERYDEDLTKVKYVTLDELYAARDAEVVVNVDETEGVSTEVVMVVEEMMQIVCDEVVQLPLREEVVQEERNAAVQESETTETLVNDERERVNEEQMANGLKQMNVQETERLDEEVEVEIAEMMQISVSDEVVQLPLLEEVVQEEQNVVERESEAMETDENEGREHVNEEQMNGKVRECMDDCVLPKEWARRLHEALGRFDCNHMTYMENLEVCKRFVNCDVCNDLRIEYKDCSKDTCTDMIKVLREVRVHYAKARTMLNAIYRMNKLFKYVLKVDRCFAKGTFEELKELAADDEVMTGREGHASEALMPVFAMREEMHCMERTMEVFGDHIETFREALDPSTYPRYDCKVCRRKRTKKQMHVTEPKYEELRGFGENAARVADDLEEQGVECQRHMLCIDCWKEIRKNEYPVLSKWNSFELVPLPEELSCLSMYELMLLSQVRPIMRLIRLQTKSDGKGSFGGVTGIRGTALYMPMPTEASLEYIVTEIPSTERVNFLLNALPNEKLKIVKQHMIRFEELIRAAQWLVNNNRNYQTTRIVSYDRLKEMLDYAVIEDPVSQSEVYGDMPRAPNEPGVEHLTEEAFRDVCEHYAVLKEYRKVGDNLKDVFANKKIVAEPIRSNAANLDTLSHLKVFPDGRGGMNAKREQHIQEGKFHKALLCQVDPRVRRDKDYITAETLNKEQKQLFQGIYAVRMIGAFGNMTVKQFKTRCEAGDEELRMSLNRVQSHIRGSDAFFLTEQNKLRALDDAWGPASLFVTLSCNEYRWTDLQEYMEFMNEDLLKPDVRSEGAKRGGPRGVPLKYLIEKDPVSLMKYYMKRFDAVMDHVIAPKYGPGVFGEVDHFYWRLEFQGRGAPHIHMKLWVRDAPILNEADERTVMDWVQKRITCRMPDQEKEPDLHSLVSKFQVHACKPKYCHRFKKSAKGKCRVFCRMGFPRPTVHSPKVLSMQEVLKSRKGKPKKLVQLARTSRETCVNDYNAALMLAWRGNIDVQYIGEKSRVLNYYISSYITKHEQGVVEQLYEDLDKSKSVTSRLMSLVNKLLQGRQIGIYEMVVRLLGMPYIGCSSTVNKISLGMSSERYRKVKDKKYLQRDDDVAVCCNMLDTYYPKRPVEMEELCVYDVQTEWQMEFDEPSEKRASYAFTYMDGRVLKTAYYMKRKTPVVLQTNYRRTTTEQDRMRYFFDQLQLYVPWRQESELMGEHASYQAAFLAAKETIVAMAGSHAKKQQMDEALERARKWAEEEPEDLEEQADVIETMEPMQQVWNLRQELLIKDTGNMDGGCMADTLNTVQRRVYESVLETIEHLHVVHGGGKCTCEKEVLPIRMFVSGVAGTGKSYLIRAIVQALTERYVQPGDDAFPAVAVLAPTGLAAYNVKGMTVHRFFNLSVQHNSREAKLHDLKEDKILMLRNAYKNVKLIIIDELSMVSNVTWAKVHARMCSIWEVDPMEEKDHLAYFGGMSMLCFGDLLQLAPVAGKFVFEKFRSNDKTIQQVLGQTGMPDIWSHFAYDELQENVRQKEDEVLQKMLDRIRIGCAEQKDIDALMARKLECGSENMEAVVRRYCEARHGSGNQAIALFSTLVLVEEFNEVMLRVEGVEWVTVIAMDDYGRHAKKNVTKKGQRGRRGVKGGIVGKKTKASDTGGLEEQLKVGVGARVMLRRNLDTTIGLVNGALGTVVQIECEHGKPCTIVVKFDEISEVQKIKRIQADYEKVPGIFVTRKQYPLILAYAMTIHKCQGMTLTCVFVDLKNAIHSKAMVYVALSRVRKLEQLHLIDFDPVYIECFAICIAEYNRLRAIECKLPPFEIVNKLPEVYESMKMRKKMLRTAPLMAPPLDVPVLDTEPKRKPRRKVPVKERVSVKTVARDQSNVLRLALTFSNDRKESCYANASTQALLNCKIVCEAVRTSMREENDANDRHVIEKFGELMRLNEHPPLHRVSVDELRTSVDDRFAVGTSQQSALEFIEFLLEKIPTVGALFRFQLKTQMVYPCCRRNVVNTENQMEIVLQRPVSGSVKWSDMVAAFAANQRETIMIACAECTPAGVDREDDEAVGPYVRAVRKTAQYAVCEEQRYLLVQLPNYAYGVRIERCKSDVTFFKPGMVRMQNVFGNARFEVVAAIRHHSDLTGEEMRKKSSGHYTCWVKREDYWLELDCAPDSEERKECVTRHDRFVEKLRDVSLLVLERVRD